MKKSTKFLIFVYFVNLLLSFSIFGQTAPPTPNPQYLYYCINDNALPLSAIPSGGGTLRWYTADTGGGFSTTAPTPSTVTSATPNPLIFYVTQVISGVESNPRTAIYVYVNQKLDLYCQIITPNSIKFDFANTGQSGFTYSYTVDGGTPVTGTHIAPSNFTVSGLNEKQTVAFTLTAIGAKSCVTSETETCTTICSPASIVSPDFSPIPTSYCLNEAPPSLPATSTNSPSVTGTWSPSAINTATTGTTNYVFTPDPVLSPCAKTKTLSLTVGPVEPNFTNFSICSGDVVANLNSTSPNGITGTWSPSNIVNTTSSASYTFTPIAGQPCAPTVIAINVTVNPSNAIVNLDWTVTDAFAKNQIVTVTDPLGVDYLYRLDDGPFQESPIFEYVSLGTHALTVANKNGCSTLTVDNVLVIDYPKYFTPNSDGFNDTWNIFSLEDQSNFRILIFDRFGKFLKEIRPKSIGWDGMYNGHPMPANDYWFSVEYAEQNIAKIFKSHFSLKR
jgi:gliding motility-associated-like protein